MLEKSDKTRGIKWKNKIQINNEWHKTKQQQKTVAKITTKRTVIL